MGIPIGLAFVSGVYVAVAIVMRVVPGEGCLDQPCQSEGVDDSVSSWGSDFYVACASLLFGLHLLVFRTGARKSAILAQIFMAGSFSLMGLTNMMNGNNGTTDNTGLKSFWIVTAMSSYALAFSACCHSAFAIQVAASRDTLNSSYLYFILARVLAVGICAAAATNIAACIMCVNSPELHTDEVRDFDADSLDFAENPRCIQIVSTSTPVMWFTYALLWIPIGGLLRQTAKELSQHILGLSTGRAALLATVFQWCTGSIFLVIISAISWYQGDMGSSFVELWNKVYGAEIFHYGILMTMYCAHNLGWTFPTSAVAFDVKDEEMDVHSESSTDDEDPIEPKIQITEEENDEEVPQKIRRKKSLSDILDQNGGEISLWALLTIPEDKKQSGSSSQVAVPGGDVSVSVLTSPSVMTNRTARTDTSGMGNWFTTKVEEFFLGPRPSSRQTPTEAIIFKDVKPDDNKKGEAQDALADILEEISKDDDTDDGFVMAEAPPTTPTPSSPRSPPRRSRREPPKR
jgi:hypothetical protein